MKVLSGEILGIGLNTTMDWNMGDPTSIVSVAPESGAVSTLVRDDERTPGTAINSADADDSFVVWADSTSADLFADPWTLMSKDRDSGKVSVLGKAPAGSKGAPPGVFFHGSYPVIHRDDALIVGDSGEVSDDGEPIPSIYTAPVDGSEKMSELIRGADQPHLSGDDLAFHRDGSVWIRNLADGSEREVDSALVGPEGRMWILAEDTFAGVSDAEDGTYSVNVVRTGQPAIEITGLSQRPNARLFASDRWVSFVVPDRGAEELPSNYLYDIDKHRLWLVRAGVTGRSAQGGGALFFYEPHDTEEQNAQRKLRVFALME